MYKLGRTRRRIDPSIPHYSALKMLAKAQGAPIPAPPTSIDWTAKLPADLGMMGNDSLGDCTCAAVYHAIQVLTANAQASIDTEPDAQAVTLYSLACGYVAGQPNTDQGGNEQDVLTYWLLNGAPLANGTRQKLAAFVEVDPSNQADIMTTIAAAGVCYIGFNVPDYAMDGTATWDVRPGNPNIVGGHAVVLAAYDQVGPTCITWGRLQKMTWAFFDAFTDEAYWPADTDWITSTGNSPGGLSLDQLEQQMAALAARGWTQ